jgi:serine/threonine-protein kinase
MGSLRPVLAAVLACSLGLPVVPVAADPPTESEKQARDLVNKATERSKAGDHKGAIDLYLQAFNIVGLPILLSNVGSEYEKLDDAVMSLKYFCKYLEAEPEGPMASYATAHAKEMQGKLHNPVDNQTVCKPPPQHPDEGSAAAGSATVPPAGSGAETGSASVVETGSNAVTAPVGSPPDPGKKEKLAGVVIGGLGVVGLGLGVYYGVQAQNEANQITDHVKGTPWPNNLKQIEADGQSDQNYQIAFLIAGGVLVAGGAVVWYLGHKSSAESAEHASIAPVVAPGYGGVALSGHW